MLPLHGSVAAVLIAFPSLMASILLTAPSRSFFAIAAVLPVKSHPRLNTLVAKFDNDNESERHLFELPSPFDFFNNQCARSCSSQEGDNGEGPFINACPKVSEYMIFKNALLHGKSWIYSVNDQSDVLTENKLHTPK